MVTSMSHISGFKMCIQEWFSPLERAYNLLKISHFPLRSPNLVLGHLKDISVLSEVIYIILLQKRTKVYVYISFFLYCFYFTIRYTDDSTLNKM